MILATCTSWKVNNYIFGKFGKFKLPWVIKWINNQEGNAMLSWSETYFFLINTHFVTIKMQDLKNYMKQGALLLSRSLASWKNSHRTDTWICFLLISLFVSEQVTCKVKLMIVYYQQFCFSTRTTKVLNPGWPQPGILIHISSTKEKWHSFQMEGIWGALKFHLNQCA